MDTTWEDAGGRFTVGHGIEVDALREAGIEEADVFIASTDGDNTNLTIAQIAAKQFEVPKVIVRVMDPARAEWYAEQGLHTICPTQYAIEMFSEALRRSRRHLAVYVDHRRRRQGRLEPRPRADRQGQRGHAHRERPLALPDHRAGARARRPVRRRHRAVGPRARGHPARRPRHRRHRRRRGQPPDLPDRQGEVPLRADHRPRQQPAEPAVLRAARHPARGQRDRPDPAPDRARGALLRARAPARPARRAAGDHRDRGVAGRPGRRAEGHGGRRCPTAC